MPLKVNELMPSLEGATQWFNGEANTDQLRGQPVLIHFWAVSCPACIHNMKLIHAWKELYVPQGLQIVAVHLPRILFDHNVDLVAGKIQASGMTWPCAVDGDNILGNRFDTGTVWPYYFLFDAEGKMRTRAAGGMGLRLLENSLNRLQQLETSSRNEEG